MDIHFILESSSDVIRGIYGNITDEIIYAVFTTPINSISASAVCAFSLKDVMASFQGQFKEQESINSNWLPIHHSKVSYMRFKPILLNMLFVAIL